MTQKLVGLFEEIFCDEKYCFLLADNSIVSMHYTFNEDGSIFYHNLAYIPNPGEILGTQKFENAIGRYLRIDCDEVGRKDFVHTLVYLHVGAMKGGTRIPFKHHIYPNECVDG